MFWLDMLKKKEENAVLYLASREVVSFSLIQVLRANVNLLVLLVNSLILLDFDHLLLLEEIGSTTLPFQLALSPRSL